MIYISNFSNYKKLRVDVVTCPEVAARQRLGQPGIAGDLSLRHQHAPCTAGVGAHGPSDAQNLIGCNFCGGRRTWCLLAHRTHMAIGFHGEKYGLKPTNMGLLMRMSSSHQTWLARFFCKWKLRYGKSTIDRYKWGVFMNVFDYLSIYMSFWHWPVYYYRFPPCKPASG